tara:strand:- start:67 stop:762 length:696 start_codon:yes stop_codon:yes gene_type:complete
MYKGKKIVAIIPARGGSKGIKLKNLKKIKKKTLIEIAYNCIAKSKLVDDIAISTDNILIKKEAKKMKNLKIINRPKALSGDKVSDLKVLKHAVLTLENFSNNHEVLLMIQPTSPLRKTKHINDSIKKLINKNYDSVWSISKIDKKYNPLKQLKIKKNKINYYSIKGKNIIARQQLENTYIRNGSTYAFKTSFIKKTKNLLSLKNNGFILIKNFQISIDSIKDLKMVEKYHD